MPDGMRSSRRTSFQRSYPSNAKGLELNKAQLAAINCDVGEEMVKDDQQQPKLRLKNGAMADIGETLDTLSYLRYLMDEEPKMYEALHLLALGRVQEADPEQVQALPKSAFFSPDGNIRQDVADVLLSSLHMSKEGPVLINPFTLETNRDKLMVEQVMKNLAIRNQKLEDWMRRNMRDNSRE